MSTTTTGAGPARCSWRVVLTMVAGDRRWPPARMRPTRRSEKDIGALRALVQQRVDVNAAAAGRHHRAALGGRTGTTTRPSRCCFAPARDVKARNRYGATPLSEAVSAGSAAMVEALLKAGADPKTLTTDDGETVLMTAARAGNADVVRLLLDRGADVNARENVQGTDRPDVGGGRTPSRRREAAARARRRLEGPLVRPRNQGRPG